MNRLRITFILLITSIAHAARAEPPFIHPGIFTSQAELDAIQKHVAAAEPGDVIFEGYQSTMKSKFADVNFTPHPVARPRRKGLKNQDTPVLERDAAMTAYTLTLRWVITGDTAARDKAISIMNAWADVFEQHEGDENRFLDSSWVITVWCAAGELMQRGKYHDKAADWPAERVDKFSKMIRNLEKESSQIIVQPFNPVSNWGTSSMLGDMSAGIFLDDHKMYDRGHDALLKYMSHIISKSGYCNEVNRDAWHGIVALTGSVQAAEVGRHQNDLSIYHARFDGQDEPRLLIALRWYANPLRGIPVPMAPMHNKPDPWEFNAKNAAHNTGGFEMALDFYEWIEPSPRLDDFRDAVLKTYRPSGQSNSLFIESDTLTQGELYNAGSRFPVGK